MKYKYKKEIFKLIELTDQYGYWSNEVLEYNKTLPYHKVSYINSVIHEYEKGRIKKEDII
jgi:hypothetical protein